MGQRSAAVTLLTRSKLRYRLGRPYRNRLKAYDPVMSDLMPPDPPFASGADYWYWLGGRPALDFVNSRRERWRRNVDCLVSSSLSPDCGSTTATLAAKLEFPSEFLGTLLLGEYRKFPDR